MLSKQRLCYVLVTAKKLNLHWHFHVHSLIEHVIACKRGRHLLKFTEKLAKS
jgi:hypothetical protein